MSDHRSSPVLTTSTSPPTATCIGPPAAIAFDSNMPLCNGSCGTKERWHAGGSAYRGRIIVSLVPRVQVLTSVITFVVYAALGNKMDASIIFRRGLQLQSLCRPHAAAVG